MFLEIEGQLINISLLERVQLQHEEYPPQPAILYLHMCSGEELSFDYQDKDEAVWAFNLIKSVLKEETGVFDTKKWMK